MGRAVVQVVLAFGLALLGFLLTDPGVSRALVGSSSAAHISLAIHGKYGIYKDGSGVVILSLRMTGLPQGTHVTIQCVKTCEGSETLQASGGAVRSKRFVNRKLRRGAVVTIRATKARYNGAFHRLVIVADPKSRTVYRDSSLCIPAGKTVPVRRCNGQAAAPAQTTVKLGTTTTTPTLTPGVSTTTTTDQTTTGETTTNQTTTSQTTTAPAVKPGDANGDGDVDCLDLGLVKTYFGQKVADNPAAKVADVNHDGVVDILDLSVVESNWTGGHTCPPDAPTGLAAQVISQSAITVSWDATPGATGYFVAENNNLWASNQPGTSFSFTGLTCATTYTISVGAVNSAGVSPASTLDVTTAAC